MYNYYLSPGGGGAGGGCDDLPPVKGDFPMPDYAKEESGMKRDNNSDNSKSGDEKNHH